MLTIAKQTKRRKAVAMLQPAPIVLSTPKNEDDGAYSPTKSDHALPASSLHKSRKSRIASVAQKSDASATQNNVDERAASVVKTFTTLPSSTKHKDASAILKKMDAQHRKDAKAAIASAKARGERAVAWEKAKQSLNLSPTSRFNVAAGSHVKLENLQDDASAATIMAIRELNANLIAIIRSQTVLVNQTKAFVRRFLGFQTHLTEAERADIKDAATAIVKAMWTEKPVKAEHAAVAEKVFAFVQLQRDAHANMDARRTIVEREMEKLAKALPAASMVEATRGFGYLSLARIIGETGDLSNYSNPSKLWKRMGLAPYNGKAASTWRMSGGLTAEEWSMLGYPPERRSVMFVIGDSILKQQIRRQFTDGEGIGESVGIAKYGEFYIFRKKYELDRNPEMKPIQAHRRAQRWMEKRLLKDLWIQWRKDCGNLPEMPTLPEPGRKLSFNEAQESIMNKFGPAFEKMAAND